MEAGKHRNTTQELSGGSRTSDTLNRHGPCDAEADGAHVGEHVVEQVVTSPPGLQVDVELAELQLDVIDVVEKQDQDPHVMVPEEQRGQTRVFTAAEPRGDNAPERVGEADEGQRDDVMHHHHRRVLPPGVHVDGSVDGVAVEAALDQVGDGDISRHRHATLPV